MPPSTQNITTPDEPLADNPQAQMAAPTSAAIDHTNPLAKAANYSAAQTQMGAEDTVEDRVSSIIKHDSPLMEQAKLDANRASGARGLLNSSMAVGAAQQSVLKAATPIASQDAATSKEMKITNQAAANQAAQFNADQNNAANVEVYRGNQQMGQIAAQGQVQKDLQNRKAEIDKELLTADGEVRQRLLQEQAEIDSKLSKQASEQESSLQAQKAESDRLLSQQDAAQQMTLLKQKGEIDKQLQTADHAQQQTLLSQQAEIDKQLKQMGITADQQAQYVEMMTRANLQNSAQKHESEMQFVDMLTKANLQNSQQKHESEMQYVDMMVRANLQASTQLHEKNMQKMTNDQVLAREKVAGDYDVLISSNQQASGALLTYDTNVANILNNPDMKTADKNAAIDFLGVGLRSSLAVIGAAAGKDYSSLLDFGESDLPVTPSSGSSSNSNRAVSR